MTLGESQVFSLRIDEKTFLCYHGVNRQWKVCKEGSLFDMDALVKKYFLDGNFNCGEAVVQILDEKYALGSSAEEYKLLSGFGGGCGCGLLCGALAGCVASLGKLCVEEKAHITPGFKEACGAFCTEFSDSLGGTSCSELKPRYFREGIRCAELLDSAVSCFDRFAQEKGINCVK